MIEKVDPLSEVGACMLAVRGCASSRGRLSTFLVGRRPSRNHAQLAMPITTPFRMICSVSEFLMLCVVRNHGFLRPFVGTRCLGDGYYQDASVPLCFLRASGKVGSFISVSIVILGVAALFQTHNGGVSLAVESDVLERICDGVSVSEAS